MSKGFFFLFLFLFSFQNTNAAFRNHDHLNWQHQEQRIQPPAKSTTKNIPSDTAAKVDEYLSRAVPYGFSGVVLLAKNGRIVLKKGYGMADREKGIPFTPGTVYNIESITKQFTAAAILKLEEQGKLRTTDSIRAYFDNVPEDKAGITLHHLLTHTAGLIGSSGGDYEQVEREAVVRRILESKLRWDPGTKWAYSNPGYMLLTAIIEKVSKQSYETFISQQLLGPAKMGSTGYIKPNWKKKKIAHAYSGKKDLGNPLQLPWAPDGPWWNLRGGGGLLSTVDDLYRWHLALKRNKVLSEASQRKAMIPYALTTRLKTHYGYAWFVSRDVSDKLLVEHGGDGLFMTEFRRYMDEDMVLILGINHRQRDSVAGPVRRQVIKLVTGVEQKLPPKAKLTLTPTQLSRYAGRYVLPSGEEFSVSVHENQLVVDTSDSGAAKLFIHLPNPQNTARLKGLTPLLSEAVKGIDRGDFGPLKAIFRPDLNFVEEEEYWTSTWHSWQKQFGPFTGSEVLGAYPDADSPDIYVLIKFERGARLARFNRNTDGQFYVDTDPTILLAPNYRFLPMSKMAFASYNFGTVSELHINFHENQSGEVTGMTVQGKPNEMVIRKVQ